MNRLGHIRDRYMKKITLLGFPVFLPFMKYGYNPDCGSNFLKNWVEVCGALLKTLTFLISY